MGLHPQVIRIDIHLNLSRQDHIVDGGDCIVDGRASEGWGRIATLMVLV